MQNKLHLGCGENYLKGYHNIDKSRNLSQIDQRVDITIFLWPWASNGFVEILSDYVLCQIHDNETFVKILNECWRVLDSGGIFKIKVPNAMYPQTVFRDPMDNRWFVKESFDHFNYEHYRWQKLGQYDGFKPWKVIKVEEIAGQANPDLKDRLYVEMQPYKEKAL